jgi:hypothetical protein
MKKLQLILLFLTTITIASARTVNVDSIKVVYEDSARVVYDEDWCPKIKHGFYLQTNYLFTDDGKPGHGFGQFFDYRISKRFYLSFLLGYTELYKEILVYDPTVTYRHLDLQTNIYMCGLYTKYFLLSDANINPYLNIGASAIAFNQDNGLDQTFNEGILTAGLGLEIPLNKKFNLIVSSNYNISHTEDFDREPGMDSFLDLSLGFSFNFSCPKPKVVCPQPIIKIPPKPEPKEVKVEEVEEKTEKVAKTQYEDLLYMIKPYDYLLDLSYKFYNDSTKWEDIYKWNDILSKTNPNLIYPFEEIRLKNLKEGILDELDYEYYDYEVKPGESLWSIAAEEYGNPLAWVIIVRDNRELLEENLHQVKPGMILKLRTKVFNEE